MDARRYAVTLSGMLHTFPKKPEVQFHLSVLEQHMLMKTKDTWGDPLQISSQPTYTHEGTLANAIRRLLQRKTL
eukprot:1653070-Amphidinium_carterae.2